MIKFYLGKNDDIIYEYYIAFAEANIFIDDRGTISDRQSKGKIIRSLYIGDPASHAARLKVSQPLNTKNKSSKEKSISIGIDKGNTKIVAGNRDDVNISDKELELFYNIFNTNINLIYYAYDNKKAINQNTINKAFIDDCNLRASFDGKKAEGKLVNPDVERDRNNGNATYTIYKKNQFGQLEPVRITKNINGDIIAENRAY